MQRRYLAALATAALLIATVGLAACGDDDGGSGNSESANDTDGAFIVEMTAHHESAIEMAQIATDRAEHPEIRELAGSIIASQGEENSQMAEIHQRLFDAPVGDVDHGELEVPGGMSPMTEADMASLEAAKPFDREFIDMIIPHHQEAIRMARVQLADGEDSELKEISTAIIEAQSAEIEELNQWREMWYGSPSPAGGVPPEDESGGSDSSETQGKEGMEGM